jgi:hypothetical protein
MERMVILKMNPKEIGREDVKWSKLAAGVIWLRRGSSGGYVVDTVMNHRVA